MSPDVKLLFATLTAPETLDTVLTHLRPYRWHAFNATIAWVAIWTLLRWLRTSRQRLRTTQLRGPPSESLLYGVGKRILRAEDSGAIYEAWAKEYGPVYEISSTLGTKRIVLCDPKAIAHFYSKDTWTYIPTPFIKKITVNLFGKGLAQADGADHKRQRKSLTPAFSVTAIRQLTSIFYDSAYKTKGAWDVLIESSGEDGAIIEVQNWMNHISLDTIGLAAFSHDFGALQGERAEITEIFDTFGASSTILNALDTGLFLLGLVFPSLTWIPTSRTRLFQRLNVGMEEISNVLMARTQKELDMGVFGDNEERSIIGLLIKGANNDSQFHLTRDEVISQMKVLLFAGYDTTSISMTWALVELSRNPGVQRKLRDELLELDADPTYDQLTSGLPYLDAVVHEVLRVHPPVAELTRVATEDDIIPLSEPVRTKSGKLVNSVTIAKDTVFTVSIECMNRSAAIWGEDAKTFRPGRWLEDGHGQNGIPAKAREIQGHRHLLTFVDGPRTCLGKNFAVTELKAVLSVLVKNFVFELCDGIDKIEIEKGSGILPRPKIAGQVGCRLPLRVRPYLARDY